MYIFGLSKSHGSFEETTEGMAKRLRESLPAAAGQGGPWLARGWPAVVEPCDAGGRRLGRGGEGRSRWAR